MNCDCIRKTEEIIADHFRTQAGDDVTVRIKGRAIGIDKETMKLTDQFNLSAFVKGSKKGFTSQKGKEVFIACSYCPFCGKPTAQNREAK